MTRASLLPYAWLLGGLLVAVLLAATVVSVRFLRVVKRDWPALHAELGRPGGWYFIALGWLTPSRFGIWLLTRPPSLQGLPAPLLREALVLRRLLVTAFALWGVAVVMAVAAGFL